MSINFNLIVGHQQYGGVSSTKTEKYVRLAYRRVDASSRTGCHFLALSYQNSQTLVWIAQCNQPTNCPRSEGEYDFICEVSP